MKGKAIRIVVAALVLLAGVFTFACGLSKIDIAIDETVQTHGVLSPETPQASSFISPGTPETTGTPPATTSMPPETPETTERDKTPEPPMESPSGTPQTPETTGILSDETFRFAGVEGDFSPFMYYSTGGLSFGEYTATLSKGKISTIEFSEYALIIDGNKIELDLNSFDYTRAYLFIVDLDAADEYYEVLLCGYGVNDWIVNTFYRYDGNSIIELAHFIGWVYSDRNGKLIDTNNVGGNAPGEIADPIITRSYYELRNNKLEEIQVPIKNITFTFSEHGYGFNFYETSCAPTPELISDLITGSGSPNEKYNAEHIFSSDVAGQRFTILDHSEVEPWYRGAWYYVLLEDGRKGVIHWGLAM